MKEIENEDPKTYMGMIEGLCGRKKKYIVKHLHVQVRWESSKSCK